MVPLESARKAFIADEGVLYLDAAAQGPRLRAVHDAALAAMETSARPWNAPPRPPQDLREDLRHQLAQLFDGQADGVALVPSAAHGLAIAAANLPLSPGDEVLVLEGQFPSNLLGWQQRCADTGATLRGIGREPGQGWTDAVLAALDQHPRIRIATLPQVRWDDGALLDLDVVAEALRARGIALVLDLSQSLGVLPADIARWQPEFVASVGYKWLLGSRGLACLWAAPRWRAHGRPLEHHWYAYDGGADWRFAVDARAPHAAGARRYDGGGLDGLVSVSMAVAAMAQVLHWQPERIAAALDQRTRALGDALAAVGLREWATTGHAPHLVALTPPPERLQALQAALRADRIACTCRHGRLRVAPHLQVTADDMKRVAETLARAA